MDIEVIYQKLCAYSAKRETPSSKALELMDKYGLGSEEKRKILGRLQEEKFIDDQRYAKAYALEKHLSANWGKYKIKIGLQQKRISSDFINEALLSLDTALEAQGENTSREKLKDLIKRKYETLIEQNIEKIKIRKKLFSWALYRGYPFEDIEQAMNDVIDLDTRDESEVF